jgi:spore maturation protein CgeB
LFKKNNANDLIKKINNFLNNPSDLQKNYQKVLSYFNYEAARREITEFIRG